jgi:hypothetical protein
VQNRLYTELRHHLGTLRVTAGSQLNDTDFDQLWRSVFGPSVIRKLSLLNLF